LIISLDAKKIAIVVSQPSNKRDYMPFGLFGIVRKLMQWRATLSVNAAINFPDYKPAWDEVRLQHMMTSRRRYIFKSFSSYQHGQLRSFLFEVLVFRFHC
jgi:hypothetical protein